MNSFPADTPVHVRMQTDAGYVRSTKPIQDLRIGDEVLAWDELAAHDAQASRQPAQLKQASHTASAINVAAAPAIPSTQRYEKVTEIAHSVKAQTLIHIALDNGQHITATAGHPFKTSEGWRDAVLLKKGGKLLLKDSESDAQAAPRYASITAVSTETKTTPVYNLEVANLHTFFVGADGVGVHNGNGYIPPPRSDELPGFPGAKRDKNFNHPTWRSKKRICQWDTLHGGVEVFTAGSGEHLGGFDHVTGEPLPGKPGRPVPGRGIRR